MILHYIKMALKVLGRRKFFTFVSLFGISFTLVVLMVLLAMFDHALAPNTPEVNLSRTLEVTYMEMAGDSWTHSGDPGYRFLDRYVRDLPGVEMFSIFSTQVSAATYSVGYKVDLDVRYTDGPYWQILDFRFLEGRELTAQDDREASRVAVINSNTREELFGGESAVGKPLELNGESYRVVGVVENVPIYRNAAAADVWVPIGTIRSPTFREELMSGFHGLILAEDRDQFSAIRETFAERLTRVEFTDPEHYHTMSGQPFTRMEELAFDLFSSSPAQMLAILGSAMLLFMLLPAINLINVNVSRIVERASEIGVRKAFGASSRHLVGQFLMENVVLCLLGGAIGYVLTILVLGALNDSNLIPFADFRMNPRAFGYALVVTLFFGVISGVYPAWRMSRMNAVEALRRATR